MAFASAIATRLPSADQSSDTHAQESRGYGTTFGTSESIDQKRTASDRLPAASVFPLGLKATLNTTPWAGRGAPSCSPVAAFQSRTSPSSQPVASRLPLGLRAIERTAEG